MQPDTIFRLVLIYGLLFGWCRFYAAVLDLEVIHERYVPNATWITVALGNTWIGLALWAVEAWVHPLTIWHYAAGCLAAGAPVIAWQLQQQREREKRKRGGG